MNVISWAWLDWPLSLGCGTVDGLESKSITVGSALGSWCYKSNRFISNNVRAIQWWLLRIQIFPPFMYYHNAACGSKFRCTIFRIFFLLRPLASANFQPSQDSKLNCQPIYLRLSVEYISYSTFLFYNKLVKNIFNNDFLAKLTSVSVWLCTLSFFFTVSPLISCCTWYLNCCSVRPWLPPIGPTRTSSHSSPLRCTHKEEIRRRVTDLV